MPSRQGSSAEPTPFETATTGGVPLTVSVPSGAPVDGVVVLHEIWGMTPPVAALTACLADRGYLVAAPHLYHRLAAPPLVSCSYAKAKQRHDTLTVDGLTSDITDTLAWLRSRGVRKVAVIGFSMGGTLALWAAATLPVDAAVTFYGAGLAAPRWPGVLRGIDAAAHLTAPWLGIYGGKDTSTPARDLKRLRAALPSDDTQSELVVYPHARHGFALDQQQPHYAADEAQDASERVGRFLQAHLVTARS